MLTLGTHFEVLLKNIRPPKERLAAARDLPPLVRDYLEKHQSFPTVEPHSRLAGSYAQDMSVGDVKDVDFLVRVDGSPEDNEPAARQVIRDLKTALDGLPEALGAAGAAGVDVEGARRSVYVYLQGSDFHLDAVPCISPDGFDVPLWVPDRGWNRWVASDPLGFVRLLDELNAARGQKVKPLGRLLKHFRNYQMKTRRPKSYWLGALLVDLVRRDSGLDTSRPLAELFRDLLDAIYTKYAPLLARTDGATPNIPDPMLGHNVSWNWSRAHFETFMRRLDEGRRWASEALELDADERPQAIALWQRVFGADYFPTDVSMEARSAAALGTPGRSSVTPAGLIVSSGGAWRVTPTRPTTFHGSGGA